MTSPLVGPLLDNKKLLFLYHKLRNRPFVKKSRSSRFSRFFNSMDPSMEEWPTSSETTIIYLQNDV